MGKYSTIIEPKAQKHLENLYEFYQEANLGTNFLASFYDLLETLEDNPTLFPYAKTRSEGIRKALLQVGKRRPQAIILYKIENFTVYILGIYDSRADWYR